MTDLLQNLIECLREELKQYGEMLALLEQQQEMLVLRQTTDLLHNVASIHAQGSTIQAARHEREQHQRNLARHLDLPDDASLDALLTLVPPAYQPLVQALVQENNDLLRRVQQVARQNHLLLSRALDLMQQFITSLCPAGGTPIYAQNGQVFTPGLIRNALYDAAG